MACHDSIGDMLTKIRNAIMAKHESVDIVFSKEKMEIVKILKSEGYIKNYKVYNEEDKKYLVNLTLKYDENNNPAIKGIKRISAPGRRIYSGYEKMPRLYNGYGTVIVSTSAGIITGKKAKQQKVGGEILCYVW